MSIRKVVMATVGMAAIAILAVSLAAPQAVTFLGHSADVYDAILSPDGRILASVSDDKTIKLWNVASPQERATLREPDVRGPRGDNGSCSVAFSPDGKLLASGRWYGKVILWDGSDPERHLPD